MWVSIAALSWALSATPALSSAPPDLVIQGARIHTLDPRMPFATALVIRDGRIVFVGDDKNAEAFITPASRNIFLGLTERTILPAFRDAHAHPMSGGLRLMRCQLDALTHERAIRAAIRSCARTMRNAWLAGSGLRWQALRQSTGRALDELVPDRPAYIASLDGFTVWVNSRALALAGLDVNGAGILRGDALMRVRRLMPRPTRTEYREALHRAMALANSYGITAMFDAAADPEMVEAYRDADLVDELTVRIVAAQRVDPRRGPEQVDEMIARRDRVRGRLFRADAAKIFLDGEIGDHSAALLAPYDDRGDSRGELLIPPPALNAIVQRLDAAGFSIHMHAMGDRAVRVGLDAIEAAIRANGPRDRRHQIAHLGVVHPDDIARFRLLGVAANFQPMWFHAGDPDTALADRALGPARSEMRFPIFRVTKTGGRIVASSDWPSTSINPLDGIQVALTHQPLDGRLPAWHPQERLGIAAAVAAYTRDAAWAMHDEGSGTIAVGNPADIVVLEGDLFAENATALHKMRVAVTLMDGKTVYRAPHVHWP